MYQYILTTAAISVLQQTENIPELMRLFGKKNSRTVTNWLQFGNTPDSPLMNVNVRQIIVNSSDLKDEAQIYQRYERN